MTMPSQSDKPHCSHALFTDLYEMTMLQAYRDLAMTDIGVFELFFRKLPRSRNFLICCGIGPLLEELESLTFSEDDLSYLSSTALFPREFLESLKDFRFTGDVYAVPEGTPVFPNEPLLEIVAPIGQAQILETLVLNHSGCKRSWRPRR